MANKGKQSKSQGDKYAPQAISDEDFVAGAIELGQRLTRHLSALENGAAGAVADVAAVLRTLIVRGEGDDVIRRLCKRKGVAIPEVLVTRAAHDGPSVLLSGRSHTGDAGGPGPPTPDCKPHGEPQRVVRHDGVGGSWRHPEKGK
jgi:hypothetical protein